MSGINDSIYDPQALTFFYNGRKITKSTKVAKVWSIGSYKANESRHVFNIMSRNDGLTQTKPTAESNWQPRHNCWHCKEVKIPKEIPCCLR